MTINYLGSISADDLPATFTKFFLEPVSVVFQALRMIIWKALLISINTLLKMEQLLFW